MKGVIQPDHMPLNKFQLIVAGLPPFVFTQISGIEETLDTVDLPDRTTASGGDTQPVEFTAMLPLHHLVEQAAMELWYTESRGPVSPNYKKAATLIHQSNTGAVVRSFSILGMFPSQRALPDLEMENEGEMAATTWTFRADQLLPI